MSLKEISDLKEQNEMLRTALQKLNKCYEEKTKIICNELNKQMSRKQQCLIQKQKFVSTTIQQIDKYQQNIDTLINTVLELQQQLRTSTNKHQIQMKQMSKHLEQSQKQNHHLIQERNLQQQRIDQIAHQYIEEINKLKQELKEFKQQDYQENSAVLKDISNNAEPNFHNAKNQQKELTYELCMI